MILKQRIVEALKANPGAKAKDIATQTGSTLRTVERVRSVCGFKKAPYNLAAEILEIHQEQPWLFPSQIARLAGASLRRTQEVLKAHQ
jgi:hypothetical protein